ncbi:unnamed protein product [Larinioides sclopetarius]|uniref:Uncharacterized protein n=1 Tax=Larinioides sclopetarius TaxID=280406 RepID=A0AAV1ZBE7_9ARAC
MSLLQSWPTDKMRATTPGKNSLNSAETSRKTRLKREPGGCLGRLQHPTATHRLAACLLEVSPSLSVAFPWLSVQPEECSLWNNGPPSVRPLVLQVKENVCAFQDTRANQISKEDGADSGITSG